MISCGARLAVFDIAELREVTSYDELELDTLGDRKTAAQVISWESAAERIGELLESGQFASNVELAEVAGYERSLLAEKLWYLYHDLSEDAREAGYLSCLSEIKGNGFPEETRHLMEQLSEPAFRQTLKEEYAAFWTAYQQEY